MSTWANIVGILGNLFQLGGPPNGPNLKNNAGDVQARNAADSAFATFYGGSVFATSGALPTVANTPNGYRAYVASQRAIYASDVTANTWSRQQTWGTWRGTSLIAVSTTGSDDNPGTVGSPILTTAEAQARLNGLCNSQGNIDTFVEIRYLNGNFTDPLELKVPPVTGDGAVLINGVPASSAASALTAVTARAASTNTPLQITDGAVVAWTPGNRVIYTGAHNGATSVVAKDNGAGAARSGSAMAVTISNGAGGMAVANSEVTPGAAETYALSTNPTFPRISITCMPGAAAGASFGEAIALANVTTSGGAAFTNFTTRFNVLVQCGFLGAGGISLFGSGTVELFNCAYTTWSCTVAGSMNISAGSCTVGDCLAQGNSVAGLFNGHLVQKSVAPLTNGRITVRQSSQVDVFDFGSFETQSVAFTIRSGSRVNYDGAACMWGVNSVASSFTMDIQPTANVINASGTTFVLASPHQGAAHATQDHKINTLGTCVTTNPSTGAVAAAIAITNANLDAAVGAAGFGGHATAITAMGGLVTGSS